MELRQLQVFVAVAEERHFGRAAKKLFLGQPAVSEHVRRLERELHIELFDRTPRHVRLTHAGEQFLEHAPAVLAAADAASAAAHALAGSVRTTLRVGTCTGLGDHLHRVVGNLAAAVPQLTVELTAAAFEKRYDQVSSGRLDAAFTHDVIDHPAVTAVELWNDPLVVVLPSSHQLAEHEQIRLADLADVPLRIADRPQNPTVRNLVISACERAGFTPTRVRSAGSLEHNLAEIGAGTEPSWTVVYASHARRINTQTETFRPLADKTLSLNTHLLIRHDEQDARIAALLRACHTH